MKALRLFWSLAFMFALGAASALAADQVAIQDETALDLVKASPSLSIAAKAIQAAGLADMCANSNVTLFLPTDDAFAALPRGQWDDLMRPENSAKLASIVKFWMVQGAQRTSDLHAGPLDTLAGKPIAVNIDQRQDELWYGPARIIQRDVVVKNGLVDVTDKVALPPDV